MQSNKDELTKAYKEVFSADGSILNCGRYKCIELINICSQIEPNKDYGDISTGFMNVANIKELMVNK